VGRPLSLVVLLACFGVEPLLAQEAPTVPTVIPSVGFGAVFDSGHPESGGMSTLIQIEMSGDRLRWGLFASVRGIGVGCTDGCDLSGRALGAEIAFLVGRVGIGPGLGLIHRFTGWHVQPHGQLSLLLGTLRVQLRVEVSSGSNGVHVPLLVGRQIRIG